MIYSVSSLQTVADCDELLNMANKNKGALLARQVNLQQDKLLYQSNSVDIEAEIPSVLAELDFLNGVIPTLPEGTLKNKRLDEKRRQECKLYMLNNRKANNGTLAVLENELEQAGVEHELTEVDAFIAAIIAKKADLD